MTRGLAWLIGLLCSRLSSEERDAVCGDLREMRFGWFRSFREVAGFLVRRELEAWKGWPSWMGLAAIVAVVVPPLNRLGHLSIMAPLEYLRIYQKYGVLYHSGLSIELEIVSWCCQTASLLVLTWAAGRAFSHLIPAGPLTAPLRILILWTAWTLFIALRAVGRGAPFFGVFLFSFAYSLLFLLPALHGASNRSSWSRRRSIVLLAGAIIAVTLLTWTGGWWHKSIAEMNGGYWPGEIPWYTRLWPWLLAAWPAAYLSMDSFRRQAKAQ